MPAPKLYFLPASPPCRSVLLTCKAIGLDVNIKDIDYFKEEHLQPWFKELNPAHTVPTMEDNGLVLWESRAIMRYLVTKHAKDDKLYPKDPVKRFHVDKMLDFDLGKLYASIVTYFEIYEFNKTEPSADHLTKIKTAMEIFDTILSKSTYAAASHLTLADITLLVTVTCLEGLEISYEEYANVHKWSKKVKQELPEYEKVNLPGMKDFKEFFDSIKQEIKKSKK